MELFVKCKEIVTKFEDFYCNCMKFCKEFKSK